MAKKTGEANTRAKKRAKRATAAGRSTTSQAGRVTRRANGASSRLRDGAGSNESQQRGARGRRIRYAVIGQGYFAQGFVLPAFAGATNSELVAVYEVGRFVAAAAEPKAVAEAIVKSLAGRLDSSYALVALYQAESNMLYVAHAFGDPSA